MLIYEHQYLYLLDHSEIIFRIIVTPIFCTLLSAVRSYLPSNHIESYHHILQVNDSLELSVYVDKIKIDLFFVFRDSESDWVGGMDVGARRRLRWSYPPIDDLCVGDLHDRLFNVPCNVEQILEV